MKPLLHWLFPSIPRDHIVNEYIASNFIANVLALGWAATPMGLKAMKELRKLNHESNVASEDMCTFLILNISSLQVIPVNIIAYRSQYGSVQPAAIVFAGLLATVCSTGVAIIFTIFIRKWNKKHKKWKRIE